MKNGLYALASLDGRPLDPRDLAVLGLADDGLPPFAARGCAMLPQDVRASAIHTRASDDGIVVLLGDLDEPDDAARTLGLPPATDMLTIVLATVERFGDRSPARLPGTWLLARWDVCRGAMTLLMANRVRDNCYVATDGRRLAIAPEMVRLARLGWVDEKPDPTDLLLRVGRAQLRRALGNRTFLRDVTRVMPGTQVTVAAGSMKVGQAESLAEPVVTSEDDFDRAVERLDAIMRRIVGQYLAREGDSAVSLSGGLDSSLIAMYAAQERGDRRLTFLTSAAPPGSGLADESGLAALVSKHLGVSVEKVVPPETIDIYRPSARSFAAFEQPLMSPRHYLDEALEQAALDHGASALINGMGGEMTVTSHVLSASPIERLRALARITRDRLRGGRAMTAVDCLHIRPSVSALERLSVNLVDLWRDHADPPRRTARYAPLGIDNGWTMVAEHPTWTISPSLRHLPPFADERLIRYAAALPLTFARHDGHDRALGRWLARRALPESIAFQRKGLAYSPNYYMLLQEHALAANTRLNDLAVMGTGEWIDLEWTAKVLNQAKQKQLELRPAFQLQLTLILAEFLVWWKETVKKSFLP